VDTVGLCHGVPHGAEQIAEVLGAKSLSEFDYLCSGINHQTWFLDLRLNGRRIGKDALLAAFAAPPVYSHQEQLRIF
ncbi:alpha-glucosidase/alpha-galactosidase, partial [Rhizobium leguminosarum]